MTEIRNSPSGPEVTVGSGADKTVVGTITVAAETEILVGTPLERFFGIEPLSTPENAAKWHLTVNQIPNDNGVTDELPNNTAWEPPGVVLGSDEVQARISLRAFGEIGTQIGSEDLVFSILAQHFVEG